MSLVRRSFFFAVGMSLVFGRWLVCRIFLYVVGATPFVFVVGDDVQAGFCFVVGGTWCALFFVCLSFLSTNAPAEGWIRLGPPSTKRLEQS